ncbi:MAG: hypothetical protein ACI9HK_001231 [Pirellulaceae bacterium]|jgi:hypothetical protein
MSTRVLFVDPDTGDDWGQRLLTRQDSTLPVVPMAVVSRKNPEELDLGSRSTVFRWYTKPVMTSDLMSEIRRCVGLI